jgi:sugar/nucleoside kinase (ribokinase family)
MTAYDIDTSLVKMQGFNGYTVTIVDKHGERTMFSYRGSAASSLELNEIVTAKIREVKVLLISGYLLTNAAQAEFVIAAAEFARKNETLVMLDPAPTISSVDFGIVRDILSCTDILAPNASELLAVSGAVDFESGLEIIRSIVPCAVVKNGAKGSVLEIAAGWELPDGSTVNEDLELVCPACKVNKVFDTTGAGDAFNAGFIASFLQKNSPMQWLENASRIAADTISKEGGSGRVI